VAWRPWWGGVLSLARRLLGSWKNRRRRTGRWRAPVRILMSVQ
jgi:hypothetical protein